MSFSNISSRKVLMTLRAIQPNPYVVRKLATPRIKNKPMSISGTYLIVVGSFSTKLPSSRGFIKAAMPVSVPAKTIIASIDIRKASQ